MTNKSIESESDMNYVAHDCRNPKCNNGWVDKDLTNATIKPPRWKYCRECCEKLGIDFDAQTPTSNLTEKEIQHKKDLAERMKRNRLKTKSPLTE